MSRPIQFRGKRVWVSAHAIKRARTRGIAFPDQVYWAVQTGQFKRFGKDGVKWVKKTGNGSIVCVGIDAGNAIIIKTIERGN